MPNFLDSYLQRATTEPVNAPPRTLQDVIARRVTLDGYAAEAERDSPFPARMVWRLAWLSVRQVQLVPTLLPDPEAGAECSRYTAQLMDFAAWLYRDLPHDTPQPGILSSYFQESFEFWRSLGEVVNRRGSESLEWLEHDVAALLWIRLCTIYCCFSVTQQGRMRTRRALAEILARALEQGANPNTLRLRTVPAIERELTSGDGWAAQCAKRPTAPLRRA